MNLEVSDMTPITVKVYLKKYQVEELDAIAQKKHKSRSGLIVDLVERLIEKEGTDGQTTSLVGREVR